MFVDQVCSRCVSIVFSSMLNSSGFSKLIVLVNRYGLRGLFVVAESICIIKPSSSINIEIVIRVVILDRLHDCAPVIVIQSKLVFISCCGYFLQRCCDIASII